jgi:EAL domain-containing protein (putative c-di-GMP-specific phosphodiesterase class I)
MEINAIGAGQLELELTESTLMSHAELNVNLLSRLKAQGVGISIDRFPIDTLKIDRGFVNNVSSNQEDAAIVRAIISLAHSLKLRVVAEGVETRDQLDFLREHSCDEAQGYYVARPVTAGVLACMLKDGSLPAGEA